MVKWLYNFRFALMVAVVLIPGAAAATLMHSTNFHLDPNVAASFGGSGSSASYKLTDAGGEAVVGAGSSQSYKLGQGYARELAQSIQLTVLPSGTYAYWPLDTGTGTQAYDSSTTGDDGTLQNTPGWATGEVGKAVTLNGTNQYITTSKQLAGQNPFTIEIWFTSGSTTGGDLMSFGDASSGASTNRDRILYMTNAGNIVFGVNNGSIHTVTSTHTFNQGGSAWHHVAATLGPSGLLLYVDGLREGTDTGTTTAGSYSGYWRMGYDDLTGWPGTHTSSFLAGTIDEARVYSRELNDKEIKNDYTAGANALHNAFTLPDITPGISQSDSVDAVVRTDAGGYDLFAEAPSPLKHSDNVTTLPGISGTIAVPILWNEGTTKGFGFTLTSGTQLEASWGTSPNYKYAALPTTTTVFHSRTGQSGGVPETTTIQYRADSAAVQKQGTYTTTVIYTATLKP